MSILTDLANELGISSDTLRDTLLESGEAESLTPNYLSVAPDGTTSATFSGHVKAAGVDLTSGNLTPGSSVQWLRNRDGSVLARINGYDSDDTTPPTDPKNALLTLETYADATGVSSISARAIRGVQPITYKAMELDIGPDAVSVTNQINHLAQKTLKVWDGTGNSEAASDFAFDVNTVSKNALFSAYLNANLAVASLAPIKFNTKLYDPSTWYDVTTGRFTPQVSGYYRCSFHTRDNMAGAPVWSDSYLCKNGTAVHDGSFQTTNPGSSDANGILLLNGTTDFVDVRFSRNDGLGATFLGGTSEHSYFTANLVSR